MVQDGQAKKTERSIQAIEARVAELETQQHMYHVKGFALTFVVVHVCIFIWRFLALQMLSCVEYDEKNQLKMMDCKLRFNKIYKAILVLLRDWLSSLVVDSPS
jgi:hypothetical protein